MTIYSRAISEIFSYAFTLDWILEYYLIFLTFASLASKKFLLPRAYLLVDATVKKASRINLCHSTKV
jgi:hypothetical protein